jgi:hypothetical protein
VTVLVKRIMDATIGSVLHATTSISHSEQNATSAENQSQEAADEEVVTLTDVEDVMADVALVETEVDEILIDVEAVMVDAVLVADEGVVTLTEVEAVMADVALVETEVVVTPTDVEDVMADAVLVETEVDEIPIAEVDEIPNDVEAVMVDAVLVETEVDGILIDVEAETVVVTIEAVMVIALTSVIEKHAESDQVTPIIVVQNQFDHVVTKETIETIEVNLGDSRSTLS